MIRIAIVEDNALYRNDLRKRLQACPDLELVLICPDGKDFMQQAQELAPEKRPEVVLMDVEMSGMDGITATSLAKTAFAEMQVLMLTVSADEDVIFRAIQAGATGYLLKEETTEEICKAVREVQRGYAFMSPAIARKVLGLLRRDTRPEPPAPRKVNPPEPPEPTLTKRELEILELVATGSTYQMIASGANISQQTVKTHVRNIYEKLQVSNKIAATQMALEKNWFRRTFD